MLCVPRICSYAERGRGGAEKDGRRTKERPRQEETEEGRKRARGAGNHPTQALLAGQMRRKPGAPETRMVEGTTAALGLAPWQGLGQSGGRREHVAESVASAAS